MITGHTPVFALLGDPVQHSLSPAIHNAWFAHHGLDGVYVAIPVPSDAGSIGPALRDLCFAGVNLTVPHKGAVLDVLDSIGPLARAAGAVNTVVRRGSGLHGANTDAEGFVRAWVEAGGSPGGAHAVILGAGGAARAVAAGLAGHGATAIVILNRSPVALSPLKAAYPRTVFTSGRLTDLPRHASTADLVVNATPGGARSSVAALSTDGLRPSAFWCDLNYWDPAPPQLASCRAMGLRTLTGHSMLVHQGALSFSLFTGVEPDLAVARLLVHPGE
ncbi:MAG: shikimate dehydrogenase [Myxococcota bacterium]